MLRAKLLGLGAFAMSILAFFIRFKVVKKQRDRAIIRAAVAETVVKRQLFIDEAESEITLEFDGLQQEAQEALKNDEIPAHLRKPRS